MSKSSQTNEFASQSSPVDEKGNLLDMPPEFFEDQAEEPFYERAQLSQNLWHHYAVR
jgi:hypothetical protein